MQTLKLTIINMKLYECLNTLNKGHSKNVTADNNDLWPLSEGDFNIVLDTKKPKAVPVQPLSAPCLIRA